MLTGAIRTIINNSFQKMLEGSRGLRAIGEVEFRNELSVICVQGKIIYFLERIMLMGVLRAIINNSFQKNFDTTFIGTGKSC